MIQPLKIESLLKLLSDYPADPYDKVCVTRDTQNRITGIALEAPKHRVSMGVQCLDPWEGKPVQWESIRGTPHWSEGTGPQVGPYSSNWIDRHELTRELQCQTSTTTSSTGGRGSSTELRSGSTPATEPGP